MGKARAYVGVFFTIAVIFFIIGAISYHVYSRVHDDEAIFPKEKGEYQQPEYSVPGDVPDIMQEFMKDPLNYGYYKEALDHAGIRVEIKDNLDSDGDVVYIGPLINYDGYQFSIRRTLTDWSLVILGKFYYKIVPEGRFAPEEHHSDMKGKTPDREADDYWGASRMGMVRFRIDY